MITDRHTVYTTLWNGGRIGIISPPPSKSDGPSSSRADEIFIDLREVWNKTYEYSYGCMRPTQALALERMVAYGGRCARR